MTSNQYNLIPLKETQSIPIKWKFTQQEYSKLIDGHRSNWCVFMSDEVVHVCRVGGEEFYRFAIKETSDGDYVAAELETYTNDDFYMSAKKHGWTDEKVKTHKVDFRSLAVEETSGLLDAYFGIRVALLDEN